MASEARISPKGQAMIGVITSILFVVMGGSFLLSQRTLIGTVLLGLGLLRASHAYRQWQYAFAKDPD